jgi:hypothetical protein
MRWLNAHAGPLLRCADGPCDACYDTGWVPDPGPGGLSRYSEMLEQIADTVDAGADHDGECNRDCDVLDAAARHLRALAWRLVPATPGLELAEMTGDRNRLAAVVAAALPALNFLAGTTGAPRTGVLFPGDSAREALKLLHGDELTP